MVTEAETPGRVPRGAVSRWNLRACSPYAPPALFTGTGALYGTADFDLSTVVSPN
jgi:hypothetical protein